MSKLAKIITPFGDIIIKLNEKCSPRSVSAIWNFLPMKYSVPVQIWGMEVFFYLPDIEDLLNVGYENEKIKLEVYDVAFWPRDPAICLFYGKTPLSRDEHPIAAEPVNVIGKIIKGHDILKKLTDGDLVLMVKFD